MLSTLCNKRFDACGRGVFVLFGLLAVAWTALSAPQFWFAAPLKDVAAHVIADERFRVDALSDLLASMSTRPSFLVRRCDLLRADALIRQRVAEEANWLKLPAETDRETAAADEALRSSLAFNPADSLLWLSMYSVEILRNGLDVTTVRPLEESYATGPLEGWIALRRNRLALAASASLSDRTKEQVISEFAGLVNSDLTEAAALNLMGPGWSLRESLLNGLADVHIIARGGFAKRLSQEGLRLTVPGVELDERQWR